ncbi:hypothetical protein AJ80_00460 [Polytolypa hystricis UAMH7299]|uniref:Glycosyltransferase 2-like domain-containing protein n=1 Tax=Polytolypa hystricis (strain UAMH7299) TaxID=1447883 RepID=A0A2B7Z3C6_POLH7|nr:hypothetical protein AJ80_00460 [Polytolypa hystricis UAMH7299]
MQSEFIALPSIGALSLSFVVWKFFWSTYNRHINAKHARNCLPLPLPEKPAYFTTDVSLLVPTINTPASFTECMKLWLANKPKEIIIVTVPRDLTWVKTLLAPLKGVSTPISVFTVPRPGRRAQMSLALRKATGKIVAFVDDDTQWPSDMVLQYLVAGFQDPTVGGVTSRQSALVPTPRRNASTVTASEVMTMRALDGASDSNAILYAAEGTVMCVTGRTMVAKAEAVQTDEFDFALTHQTWNGRVINTGDDGFVTHWLRNHGWNLAFQSAPEAEIFTLTESGSRFLKQLVRWRRSGFRDFIALICFEPGFRRIFKKHPRYAVKSVLFILKPLTTALHLIAWSQCLYNWPYIAFFFLAYYIYRGVSACRSFKAKHPWLGNRNLWAVFAMDYIYQIINFYVVLTLGTEGWMTRDDSPGV